MVLGGGLVAMTASDYRRRLIEARHAKLVKLAAEEWAHVEDACSEAATLGEGFDAEDARAMLVDGLTTRASYGELPYPKPTVDELRGLAALALPHVESSVLEELAESLPRDVLLQAFVAALPKLRRSTLETLVRTSGLEGKQREALWFLDPEAAAEHTNDIELFARIEAQRRMPRTGR
jgi:hypothetical protein